MNEILSDSTSDHPGERQANLSTNGIVYSDTDENNAAFIVTDPDSDIETDAAPDAPRPRGTPIPEPPKPNNLVDEEPPLTETPLKKSSFTKGNSNNGKIPGGFSKSRKPQCGAKVMVNIVQSQGVHIGSTYTYDFGAKQNQNEEVSPPKFEILMSSIKTVSDAHLDCVANNIGQNWAKLGKLLGLNEAALYRAKQDYSDNHREKVYQLLLEWKQSTGGPNQAPLLSRLSLALWQLREENALDGLLKLEKDPRLSSK